MVTVLSSSLHHHYHDHDHDGPGSGECAGGGGGGGHLGGAGEVAGGAEVGAAGLPAAGHPAAGRHQHGHVLRGLHPRHGRPPGHNLHLARQVELSTNLREVSQCFYDICGPDFKIASTYHA